MEQFYLKTRILSGPGSISFLEKLHAKRLFLLTDPYFVKSGMADRVLQAAHAEESMIFDRVTPDPSAELAAEGTAEFQKFRPDLLVALGGGSSLDCAKAISFFSKQKVPFAAIPTTSGSGSEVTDFAILTHHGIKHPLVDPSLQPDYAILDSDLLQSLPKSLIADAGFDVLSHALEAIAAKNAGAFTDLFAKEAFRLAYCSLEDSYEGKIYARQPVHLAAVMAGIAFNGAGLGLCHGLSHTLGGLYHVPHGRLNGILMPAVLEVNSPAAGHRYAELWRSAGFSGTADTVALRNLQNGLLRLRRQLHLPETLQQAGISPAELWSAEEKITESVLKDPCCRSNPVPVDGALIRTVLQKVAGHG